MNHDWHPAWLLMVPVLYLLAATLEALLIG